jgi:anti-sigma factor RsiW
MTEPANPECRALKARISAYLDGELAGVECAAIDAHCAGCPGCAAFVTGLRQTIGLCHDVGKAPLPEAVLERARERVRRLLESSDPPEP